jgi:hypothetical protein
MKIFVCHIIGLLVALLGMEEVGLHFDWVECDGPFLLINKGMKMYYIFIRTESSLNDSINHT